MIKNKGNDINKLLGQEWLTTNGIGGYASSSVSGANTRRYHGLLVASLTPPTERRVLLAKLEERVNYKGQIHDLSVNQYPDVIFPKGYKYLSSFDRRPLPTWNYVGKQWKIKKKVFMVAGSNTTIVSYTNEGKEDVEIEVHPLLSNKSYHETFHENGQFDFYYEQEKRNVKVYSHYGSEPFYMTSSKGGFSENRSWYKNIQLPRDQYRGQDYVEDYYRLGFYTIPLEVGETIFLLFTTDENQLKKKGTALEADEIKRVKALKNNKVKDAFYNDLLVAGDQFVVKRASTNSYTILAGYHWFTDWGRDTMIAMRGLTIATGRQEVSKSILSTFFKHLDQGMLPNRFPDYTGQEVEYNTIDATLWLFVALYDYYQKFNDKIFVEKHLGELQEIINVHISGTRYNIHVTDEGLLYGGEKGMQLTWMDARIGDYVVTARMGCPVEINALWYNVLCVYEFFVDEIKPKKKGDYTSYKNKIQKNFIKYFLNDKGYLNDVVLSNQEVDDSFRPNQLYALSLPFSLLSIPQEKKVLQQVKVKLLTGYGLKTLPEAHPDFVSQYGGDQWKRDTSYHQGTIWPFIISEYYSAYLKVNKYSGNTKKEVKKGLEKLNQHFYQEGCLHGISEIFDGKNPKEGRGTAHQAWSVSAIIKLYADYKLY